MPTIQQTISSGDATKTRRTQDDAAALLDDLKAELKLSAGRIPQGFDQTFDPLAKGYIVDVILPVKWYNGRIEDAKRQRTAYLVGSAVLILAVPVAVALLPTWLPAAALAGGAPWIAQLTAVLTGVLALQKTLGGWLDKQQRFAAWWNASSDLKNLWYALQTKWSVAEIDTTKLQEEMKEQISRARAIVNDEQSEFFKNLSTPTDDILNLLKSTHSAASGLVTALRPDAEKAQANAEASQKAQQDFRKLAEFESSLQTEITKKVDQLNQLPAADDTQKTTLAKDIAALREKRSAVMLLKIEAEANVKAKS